MQLSHPCCITPRLLPGVKVGNNSFVSIEYAGETSKGRTRYRYHIDGPGVHFSRDDLQSGCGGGDLRSGLESLMAFLVNAAEIYGASMRSHQKWSRADISESGFSKKVCDWAYQNSDEISMLQLELQETPDCIEE